MRVSNLESAVFGVLSGSSPIRSSRLSNCLTRLTQERSALVVIHPQTRTDKAALLGSQQQSGWYLAWLLRASDVFHPGEGLIPSTRPAVLHYR
jgi:hypothetical protein